jgi:hypothetical protein
MGGRRVAVPVTVPGDREPDETPRDSRYPRRAFLCGQWATKYGRAILDKSPNCPGRTARRLVIEAAYPL